MVSDESETAGGTPVTAPVSLPAPGTVIDRYRIVGRLGEGGMGVVFRAVDVDLEREVALKVLRPGRRSTGARTQLLDEARAMAKLRHPHVLAVHDVGTAGGHDFIAMELVGGENLATWARRSRSWREVVAVYVAAGRGLAAAHAAGIVHRDFKPGNVLVETVPGATGVRVVVGDFGLARDIGEVAGEVAGTAAYMAPEQLEGGAVDARADQFGFCVALHEALCGRRPLAGDAAGELDAGAAPARIRRVLARGVAVEREHRHRDMPTLLGALESALATRRRVLIGIGAVAAVASVAFAVVGSRGGTTAAPPVVDGCDGDPFATTWPVGREPIGEALAARPAARDTVLGGLDRYRGQWRSQWIAACERAPRDMAAFHEAAACLLDARDQTATLVDELAAPSPTLLDGAVAAVESLPDPALCVGALEDSLPVDPARRDRVRTIEAELARIRGLVPSRPAAAVEAAERALADARALGHPPLVARALYELGAAMQRIPNVPMAREVLAEAELAAEEADCDEVRAQALVALAVLEVDFSSDVASARRATRRAAASVARDHRDPALRAELLVAMATLAERDGELSTALAHLEEAAAIHERLGALIELAAVQRRQAHVLGASGERARALAVVEAALARLEPALGIDDPATLATLISVARALGALGQHDQARARISEALRRRPRDFASGDHEISGVVVDAAGRPVAGADVVVTNGDLHGDGRYLTQPEDPWVSAGWLRTAVTDDVGRFSIHADADDYLAIAQASEGGRSEPVTLQVDGDETVTLTLSPWAELHGVITGDVPADAHLHIGSARDDFRLEVPIVDGHFRARVASGRQVIQVVRTDNSNTRVLVLADAEVEAAGDLPVDLAVRGTLALTVHVRGERGIAVPSTVVMLMDRPLDPLPSSGGDIYTAFAHVANVGRALGEVATPEDGGGVMTFEGLEAATWTVCAASLPGDWRDPVAREHMNRHMDQIEGRCTHVALAASPARQELTIAVPPAAHLAD